jgi:hypothetical protein
MNDTLARAWAARDLVERFLGRKVSSEAFFAEIRGE